MTRREARVHCNCDCEWMCLLRGSHSFLSVSARVAITILQYASKGALSSPATSSAVGFLLAASRLFSPPLVSTQPLPQLRSAAPTSPSRSLAARVASDWNTIDSGSDSDSDSIR